MLENPSDQKNEIPGRSFAYALIDAVNTMAGISLDMNQEMFDHEARFDCNSISGIMILTGKKNAVLLITTDRESAKELVSYMTGLEQDELTEKELNDVMMEIVNMVAGSAKAKIASTKYAFKLSSPMAIVGDFTGIVTKSNIKGYLASFSTDSIQITLKLFYI